MLRILALSFLSLTAVKRDVSSAKSLTLDFNLLGKSLIQIRKRGRSVMEPWGTPAKTRLHDDVCPFKTTL